MLIQLWLCFCEDPVENWNKSVLINDNNVAEMHIGFKSIFEEILLHLQVFCSNQLYNKAAFSEYCVLSFFLNVKYLKGTNRQHQLEPSPVYAYAKQGPNMLQALW